MDNILLVLRHTKKQLSNDLKYNGIINAFKRMGYCVWYTFSDGESILISNGVQTEEIGKINLKLKGISRNTALYKGVREYIKNKKTCFKYCYIRSVPATPGYAKMLKAIRKSGTKTAVEIPTYPNTGERNSDKFITKELLKISDYYGKKASRYTDLYLPMGEKTDSIFGRPAVNIENGVDISLIHKRKYSPKNSCEIHLIGVAKVARWHGYERIIEGMRIYYENKPDRKVYFHIIGSDGDGTLKRISEKIDEYKLRDYVILEGFKYAAEADEFFNMADAAIASLNITGMKSVYPLKIGEYMARGIPFLYSENCTQVKEDWDFCMETPVDNSPIDIKAVAEFAKRVSGVDVSAKMREIAEKDLTWEQQLERMIDYFETKA